MSRALEGVMAGYFDLEYLRNMGSVPEAVLDDFDLKNPDRIDAIIAGVSRLIDSYLLKRYATPFKQPVPESVKLHGVAIVSYQLRTIIGFDPGSAQDAVIQKARDDAFTWLEQAANAKDGLVELPLREPEAGKADKTGVARRKARAFSYASAIAWHRAQKDR